MDCSIKTKFSIQKNLDSILKREFTESNIKELLIDIREFIAGNAILREMADFIAHPTRDKGLCHSDIDLIYTKLKFTVPPNTEKFNVTKIPQNLFDTLLIKGVTKIDDGDLVESTGINKQKLQHIIKKNYKVRNKIAILENRYKIDEMVKGLNYLLGHIEIKSVFSQEEFIGALKSAISILQEKFKITGEYSKAIEDNSNDIMICLISLLHDAKMTLFDNTVGKLFISLVGDPEMIKKEAFDDILIGLFVRFELEKDSFVDIVYEIIETKAKASDYIEHFQFDKTKGFELAEIVTTRKNGNLILEKIN
jgi:hypothetical protein